MYAFELHFSGSFVNVLHEDKSIGTIQPDFTGEINFSSDSRIHSMGHEIGEAMWDEFDVWALATGLATERSTS